MIPVKVMRFVFVLAVLAFNHTVAWTLWEGLSADPNFVLLTIDLVGVLAAVYLIKACLDWFRTQAELERLEKRRRFLRKLNAKWIRESAIQREREFLEGNDDDGFPLGRTDWN